MKGKAIAQASRAKMVIVLITSFFLLAIIIFALRWQRISSRTHAEQALAPPRPGSLFAGEDSAEGRARFKKVEAAIEAANHRSVLLARAINGDRAALLETHASGDKELYEQVLDELVEVEAVSEKRLLALVSYLTRHDHLKTSRKLVLAVMENWQPKPDRSSTAKLLHLAALADDARLYQEAVEAVRHLWRAGRIPDLTAEEFRTLADGEYWLLSADTRSSGAGFKLKLKLAELRRELATTTHLR